MGYYNDRFQLLLSDLNDACFKEEIYQYILCLPSERSYETLPMYFDCLIDITRALVNKLKENPEKEDNTLGDDKSKERDDSKDNVEDKTNGSMNDLSFKR